MTSQKGNRWAKWQKKELTQHSERFGWKITLPVMPAPAAPPWACHTSSHSNRTQTGAAPVGKHQYQLLLRTRIGILPYIKQTKTGRHPD